MNEDSTYQLSAASFGFTDPNDASEGEPNTLSAIFLTSLPNAGSLSLAGSPVTVGQRVSVSALSTGSGFTFTPAANAFGSPYTSFQFRAQDNGGTVFGGVDTDPTPNSIVFNVLPVNDPPVITAVAGPVYVSPTDTAAITTGTFTASDVDPGTTLTFGVVSPSVDNGVIVSKVGKFGTLYVRKATGDFEFHPNSDAIQAILANTSETFQVSATDGVATATTRFVVNLTAANRSPELTRRSGTVTTPVTTSTDYVKMVAMQADGKILAVGESSGTSSLAIVRYNSNGTLDASFGGGDGIVTNTGLSSVGGALLQPDGKIVVVASNSLIARFNTDGTADTSFGTNGVVNVSAAQKFSNGRGVAIQADGRLIVVGYVDTLSTTDINYGFAVVRLNTNGTLDTSFDGDGYKTINIGTGSNSTGTGGAEDYATAVAVQADGKIVVAGRSDTNSASSSTFFDISVIRLNTDGSLDASFSDDGIATADYNGTSGTTDDVFNLLIASGGQILVATPTGLMQFTATGGLDSGFGNSGRLVSQVNADGCAAIDASGRIVLVGTNGLRRYSSAGVADDTFGSGGFITTSTSTSISDYGQRVFVQPDGRVVIGGSGSGSGYDFRLQRFNTNGTTDVTFGDAIGSLGGTAAHTEGGNPTPVDMDVGVCDPELSALNAGLGDFNGASLRLARASGAIATDLFGIALGQTVPAGQVATFTISGANQFLLGSKSFGSFSQAGGALTISFAGTGSVTTTTPTTALVNEVLQRITYQTTSVTPPPSVQLLWTFSDGNTGSQGGGGALSATGTSTITITATNSAPTAMTFANVTASLRDDANTALRTKLADILVEDDGMGTNVLSLVAGFDSTSFEMVGNALFLKAGVPLLYETKSSYLVRVQVTDSSIPFSTITKDYTLKITGKPISIPSGQTATDAVIRFGDYQLLKQGGGTLILDRTNSHSGGTIVEAGEVIVRNVSALGTGALHVRANARVTLDVNGANASVGGLSFADGGLIDFGYGRLIVASGGYSLPAVIAALQAGFVGNWSGSPGLASRNAGAIQGGGLGYVVNEDGSLTFGFAASGDTNLDGTVDILDVSAMLVSGKFNTGESASWSEGDFNYDGTLDILDIAAMLSPRLYDAGSYMPSPAAQAESSSSSLSATDSAFLAWAAGTTTEGAAPPKKGRLVKA